MKTFFRFLAIISIGLILIVIAIDLIVKDATDFVITDDIDIIPKHKVGLLLGTSKYRSNGKINEYYTNRIAATYELYEAGKIENILISGDNSRSDYDEPSTMKNDLVEMGVPESKIYLDYAGFRTLDSIIRAKEIFGLDEFTIISQRFHNERAVYIADTQEIYAWAYNAKDVTGTITWGVQIREKLARVKMMIDLAFGVEPKFLGEQIIIEL